MPKLIDPERKQPMKYGKPVTESVMDKGYGTVKSSNPKESAIVRQSRSALIRRLGIAQPKSKRG